MRVIIAGSRAITDANVVADAVADAVRNGLEVSEVVSGCARGVDQIGEELAAAMGVPVRRFPANWSKYGKRAGMMRNREMAEYADALITVWDGESAGTADMIGIARRRGLTVYVWRI